jgi:hypothetical protein
MTAEVLPDAFSCVPHFPQRVAARDALEAIFEFEPARIHAAARDQATTLTFAAHAIPRIEVGVAEG